MAYDVTVILEHRPGMLARMGEVLGDAGINIDGMCGLICEGKGVIHILVKNGSRTRKVLVDAGMDAINVRPVLVRNLEDKPGTLGEVARKLADNGVNIDLLYLGSDNRIVLGIDPGSDDWDKAKSII